MSLIQSTWLQSHEEEEGKEEEESNRPAPSTGLYTDSHFFIQLLSGSVELKLTFTKCLSVGALKCLLSILQ